MISTFLFSEKTKALIDKWLEKFPPEQKQSGVLYALTVVQKENGGYLTKELMDSVADYLNMPKIAVYEVASFYSLYELKPVGQHKIQICTNISCQLAGCEKIVKHLKDRLKIEFNETTKDGLFTLKSVECLAACGAAPVLQIEGRYHEHLTEEKVDKLLTDLGWNK